MKASIGLVSSLVLGAMAATAVAGAKLTQEVKFDLTKGSARGSLADARNSADTVQYIGCQLEATYAICTAVNSLGEQHSCHTNDPGQLTAISRLNDESYLFFRWSNVDGTCFQITVTHDSRYAPK
jgi:hypothetical protein